MDGSKANRSLRILFCVLATLLAAAVAQAKPAAKPEEKPQVVPVGPGAKTNVCSITINSDDEIKAFKAALGTKDFNYYELTTLNEQYGDKLENRHDWFQYACSKQIRCDVLILSGHFGGNFFGDTGLKLLMEDLERASCSAKCDGVIQAPKEVYLFGCNTLAGKDRDARTPEQYRRALLDHNPSLTAAQAEQIVAYRYSPLGQAFGDRMTRIFRSSPRIYGFDSKAPLGSQIKPHLERYLRAAAKTQYYTPAKLAALGTTENSAFKAALKGQALVQKPGTKDFKREQMPACYLDNPDVAFPEKVAWLERTLNGGSSLQFLPAINDFLARHQDRHYTAAEQTLLGRVTANQQLRQTIEGITTARDSAIVGMQMKILTFMRFFNWLTRAEYDQKVENLLFGDLNTDFTIERRDQICSESGGAKVALSFDRIPEARWKDPEFLRALTCASYVSKPMFAKLLELFLASAPESEIFKATGNAMSDYPITDNELPALRARLVPNIERISAHAERVLCDLYRSRHDVTVTDLPSSLLNDRDHLDKLACFVQPNEQLLRRAIELENAVDRNSFTSATKMLWRWNDSKTQFRMDDATTDLLFREMQHKNNRAATSTRHLLQKAQHLKPAFVSKLLATLEQNLLAGTDKDGVEWLGILKGSPANAKHVCAWAPAAIDKLLASGKVATGYYLTWSAGEMCGAELAASGYQAKVVRALAALPLDSDEWKRIHFFGWGGGPKNFIENLVRSGAKFKTGREAHAAASIFETVSPASQLEMPSADFASLLNLASVEPDLVKMLRSHDTTERNAAIMVLAHVKATQPEIPSRAIEIAKSHTYGDDRTYDLDGRIFRLLQLQNPRMAFETFRSLVMSAESDEAYRAITRLDDIFLGKRPIETLITPILDDTSASETVRIRYAQRAARTHYRTDGARQAFQASANRATSPALKKAYSDLAEEMRKRYAEWLEDDD